VPLRSVEAASRDDAIAAAREQFGPTARVVGVRRVRSGGVLGFFATERYVAEVDPETPARPAGNTSLDERARAAAESIARLTARTEDPVDELADLLGSDAPAEPLPTYTRTSVQRAATETVRKSAVVPAAMAARAMRTGAEPGRTRTAVPVWPAVEADDEGPVVPEPGESAAPSRFTAALARMVSGDREVRQAVQDALDEPADERRDSEPSRPTWAAIVRAAEKTAQSGAPHQEEEPVDEQIEQSPGVRAVVFPAWGAEAPAEAPAATAVVEEPAVSEPAASSLAASSPREDAVADILRAALAQGQSDEALADILRRVLAGSSATETLAPEPTLPVELPVAAAVEVPVAEVPVAEVPVAEVPVAQVEAEPVVEVEPVFEPDEPVLEADEPVFAEVVLHEPAAPAPVVEAPVVEAPVAEAPTAEPARPSVLKAQPVVETTVAPEALAEEELEEEPVEEVPVLPLARTASDPAPLPADATTIMPPLSLLPPLASARRGGGLPPVPPSRTAPSSSPAAAFAPSTAPMPVSTPATPLATVVRLPFAPLPDVDFVDHGEPAAEAPVEEIPMSQPLLAEPFADEPVVAQPAVALTVPVAEPEVAAGPVSAERLPAAPAGDLVARLIGFGIPEHLLGAGFAAEAAAHGTYAALTTALATRLPAAPALPTGPGEVLFLVGPGVETLRAARALAATLRLDPERVQWATRGDLAALAPKGSRMTTIEAAIDRRQDAARSGTMTIVAVDAPLRTDAYWMSQMLAIWTPSAVWAVVEATRKPEDLEQWLGGLPRVDALVVQDSDLSADPAAVLARVATPVALLDGVPATAHRWASLVCERLETLEA
jgi:hypothetical protein